MSIMRELEPMMAYQRKAMMQVWQDKSVSKLHMFVLMLLENHGPLHHEPAGRPRRRIPVEPDGDRRSDGAAWHSWSGSGMTGTADSSSSARPPRRPERCEEMEGLRREQLRRLVAALDDADRAVVLQAARALGRRSPAWTPPTPRQLDARPALRGRTLKGAPDNLMEAMPSAEEWAAKDPALDLPHRRKMQILFAILLGMFLSALDQTIVGTSLPTITRDLHGSSELYTWVVTIYLLTATITGVFYGKLSDIYGRRPMLLIGISIFLIGSALSGLSWSMESLILFRGIQGVGAGAIFPISLAVIGDLFTPRERGKYQGLFGAVFGVSAILGPLLGGWLTQNLSWHWIFWVNLPIGLVALAIIYRFLPNVHGEKFTRNLDYLGAAVFTVAVSALLIGLTKSADRSTGATRGSAARSSCPSCSASCSCSWSRGPRSRSCPWTCSGTGATRSPS